MQLKPIMLFEGIHWVGALDPDLRRFDVVMETQDGTSYNSYLVQGTEKTVLIDAVKEGFFSQSEALVRQLIDPSQIDYIVLQHTEPDHSGSILQWLQAAPHARILCSKAASLYLPHIANRELPIDVVKEGDTLDLGGKTLRFISAPFLHWPDTLFTYEEATGALLTCDAFGCHYASEHVVESKTGSAFHASRRYYYDCIVSPFAPHVKKAIAHVAQLQLPKITAILPSHGPVLDEHPMDAVELYDAWASERAPLTGNRVFVGYVTCYGYTRALAEAFCETLRARRAQVDLVDLTTLTAEEAANRAMDADAICIGTPTVNADSLPPVWELLSLLSVPVVRGRHAAAFGSFGWSGEAVPMVEQRLTALGLRVTDTVRARFRPDQSALDEVSALADRLATALQL